MLRILGAEKYKGMMRLSFIAGRRVLRNSRMLNHNAGIVSHALKVPLGDTGQGVLDFLDKTAHIERRLKVLEEEAVRVKAEALLRKAAILSQAADDAKPGTPVVVIETYKAGMDEVQAIGHVAQRQTQALLVLASEQDLRFAAFCSAKGFDLRPHLKEAFDRQGGRGGGSASFFQGSFGTKEALDSFLLEIGTIFQ